MGLLPVTVAWPKMESDAGAEVVTTVSVVPIPIVPIAIVTIPIIIGLVVVPIIRGVVVAIVPAVAATVVDLFGSSIVIFQ